MCVSTGLLRTMGIILRTQKMAAGHVAAAFHNTSPISLSKIQVLGAVPGRVPGTGARRGRMAPKSASARLTYVFGMVLAVTAIILTITTRNLATQARH